MRRIRYSAEEAVLLAALQTVVRGKPLPPLPPVEWPALLSLAEAHQLSAALAYAVERALAEAAPPPTVASTLATQARRQRVRTAVQTDDLSRIARAMSIAGVPIVALKGSAVAHLYYPTATLRTCNDLDLLVRPADVPSALACLYQLGFEPHPTAPSGDWHHVAPMRHPRRRTVVELHTDVVRRFRPNWPVHALWSRSVVRTVAGVEMRVLSIEDQLIHTVLHARHTLFSRMRDIVDIALLLRQPVDGALLGRRATDAGAASALAHGQRLAARWGLLDAASPPVPNLKPGQSYTIIAPWRTLTPNPTPLSGGPLASAIEVWLLDSPRDAMQLARALARPDPLFMQQAPQYGERAPYLQRAESRVRRLLRDSAGLLRRRTNRERPRMTENDRE